MRLRASVLVTFFVVASLAGSLAGVGRVSGTVVFVSDTGQYVGDAPYIAVHVDVADLRGEFTADAIGDFSKQIPSGKYTITGVVGCGGQKLLLYPTQTREFVILPGDFKRIDVLVRTPNQKYECVQRN